MHKIVSITWARNEEDILESFVHHHAPFVDKMIIVLHRSTDRSRIILQKLLQQGLPVEIRESAIAYHAQGEVLTTLLHEVASLYSPQWILPLDADEFLCPTRNIKDILRSTPSDVVSLLPWKTYVPTSKDNLDEPDVRIRMQYRRAEELNQFYKVLIPGSFALHSYLPMGSHALFQDHTQIPWPSKVHEALWISHFPVRSAQQLRMKIVRGWEAHSQNPQKKLGQNFHWEELYDRCTDPSPIDRAELQSIAYSYATVNRSTVDILHDPIPTPAIL